jgi:hypothetical protein
MDMRRGALAAAVGAALLITGCASTRVDGQWSDPGFANRTLRDTKVLVSCRGPDTTLARLCEERLVDALRTSPAARRIIKAHWSAARRPRRNADLTPARAARAPQQDAKAPPGSVKASQFLTPGHELRAQHIAKKRSP